MNNTNALRIGVVALLVVVAGAVATSPVGAQDVDGGADGPGASVTFQDQTLTNATVLNATVTVQSVNLSEGGFVALYSDEGQFLGVSEYLTPGLHENVTVALFQPVETPDQDRDRARNATGGQGMIDENATPGEGQLGENVSGDQRQDQTRTQSATLLAIAHTDGNDDEAFDYVASNGTEDVPYVDGGIALDTAVVMVE